MISFADLPGRRATALVIMLAALPFLSGCFADVPDLSVSVRNNQDNPFNGTLETTYSVDGRIVVHQVAPVALRPHTTVKFTVIPKGEGMGELSLQLTNRTGTVSQYFKEDWRPGQSFNGFDFLLSDNETLQATGFAE